MFYLTALIINNDSERNDIILPRKQKNLFHEKEEKEGKIIQLFSVKLV